MGKFSWLCGAVFAVSVIGSEHAATVVLNTNDAPLSSTSQLTGFATTGALMNGMVVRATYADGSVAQAIWGATVGDAGAAIDPAFALTLSGDTFTATWNLFNTYSSLLTTLHINAGVGDTVFDIDGSAEGTAGSAFGAPFSEVSGPAGGTVTANYSQAVKLNSDALPFGDLFAQLLIDFRQLDDGGLRASYGFRADTDNLELPGDLQPVPLPAALPLFAAGLGLMGFFNWRRKRQTQAAAAA